MASSIIYEDDRDDLLMEFEYEDDESDEDDGEVGDGDDESEENSTEAAAGPWMYEPLPHANDLRQNVGDAEPPGDPGRLQSTENW